MIKLPAETIFDAEGVLPRGDRFFMAGAVRFVGIARPIDLADPVARVPTESLEEHFAFSTQTFLFQLRVQLTCPRFDTWRGPPS